MVVIAHRGNLEGPNPSEENKPEYIQRAIDAGFDVEIDVWVIGNEIYLGHDKPQYLVDFNYLRNASFWCHAKNLEALELMLCEPDIHCFWHESDKYTITTEGIIWTYPGRKTSDQSVIVVADDSIVTNVFGVCTDYPLRYSDDNI